MGLREQEAAQRAAVGVEPLRLVPQPQEHLLHDLLGLRLVAQQPLGEPEHRAGVAAVHLGQRVLLVAGHARRTSDGVRESAREVRLAHALCTELRARILDHSSTLEAGDRLDVVRVREQVEHRRRGRVVARAPASSAASRASATGSQLTSTSVGAPVADEHVDAPRAEPLARRVGDHEVRRLGRPVLDRGARPPPPASPPGEVHPASAHADGEPSTTTTRSTASARPPSRRTGRRRRRRRRRVAPVASSSTGGVADRRRRAAPRPRPGLEERPRRSPAARTPPTSSCERRRRRRRARRPAGPRRPPARASTSTDRSPVAALTRSDDLVGARRRASSPAARRAAGGRRGSRRAATSVGRLAARRSPAGPSSSTARRIDRAVRPRLDRSRPATTAASASRPVRRSASRDDVRPSARSCAVGVDVLPVAPAAAAARGTGTAAADPVRRRLEHVERRAPWRSRVVARRAGASTDLAGQRAGDEHHPPAGLRARPSPPATTRSTSSRTSQVRRRPARGAAWPDGTSRRLGLTDRAYAPPVPSTA